MEKYKVFTEQEGVNHVKVFKASGTNYINDWNFSLKGDSEPIIFKGFYTESRFAIVNWDGWIRLYDASTKSTLLDHKLNGKIDSSAIFSLDKSKLYVVYKDDSYNNHLAILDVFTYEIETISLPDVYQKSINIRKDGCLLFYKHDWENIDNEKIHKHFYSVLNLETQKIDQFELAYAPQFSFGEFKPVIDMANNWVIMPLYDDISNKTNTSGEIVFEYRIALFDLNTFDITQVLSVRNFPENQLGYDENDGKEMAELFMGTDRDDDYAEMQQEFIENLNTIKVGKDGMWLCWRGGIVRKINSDFTLSPLLATASRPHNSLEGMFNHGYFHSHLYNADNTNLILKEGNTFYKAAMPNLDSGDIETPIALQLEKTSPDEIYNLSYSKEDIKEIELRDFIQIRVTDLSAHESIMDVLDQIEIVVADLKAAGIGHTLLFAFSDTKENTLNEPEFFAKAVSIAPERIQQILEKLMANNAIKYLYRNEEETVLCQAVFELAQKGENYLNTVIKYLDAIDLDHDVYNQECLIPFLEQTYSVAVIKEKAKAFSPQLSEWYEYYREEYDL